MTTADVALTGVRRPSLAGRVLAPLALLAIAAATVVGLSWWVMEGTGWLYVLVLADTMTAAVVGWLVVRRRPGNAVGALLLAHAVAASVILMSPDESSPSWPLVDQLLQGSWVLLYVFIALIGYVFPDGHIPSRFWRRYVAACLAGHVLFGVLAAFDAQDFRETHPGVTPAIDISVDVPTWLQVVALVLSLGSVPALLVGAVVCAARRLKRSEGE
ncbi:MAG TPA: hypothetical protein VK640_06665, partial [Actinomycetes bacterium]|nr:hypothetical protein [Actinomycetes bacterium]